MLARENFDKNGAIWCNLGVPKYAITKLKISNFKVNKSTTTKDNLQGGWGLGAIPPKAEEILKNQTKWRFFLYFFCFLAGLPRSPKL